MKGGRKLSQWNLFVKKVYHEGKAKDKNYEFKQALEDASKRKSEMGNMKLSSTKRSTSKRSRSMAMSGGKSKKRCKTMSGRKSCKRRIH